jgi:uncharacterized delta-60 repeat protein
VLSSSKRHWHRFVRPGRTVSSTAQSAISRASVESLEGRVFLTATVSSVTAPNVTAASSNPETVEVVYNSDSAVSQASISTANIAVTGPTGTTLAITGFTSNPPAGDNPTETVDYTVAPPAGGWSFDNDGMYTISLGASPVSDDSGAAVTALAGSFQNTTPDTTPPSSQISAPNITSAGGTTQTVTIVYSDPTGINTSTIGTGDISVAGAGGNLTVASVATNGTGTSVTATYTVNAPAGGWENADNGNYTITLKPNQVKNNQGVSANSATGNFNVNVAAPVPPSASISAPNVTTAGGTTEAVTVVFTDSVGIDTSTIDPGNITVSGPGSGPGASNLTVASVTTSGTGTSVTATYTIDAPGGTWNNADNGNYTITLKPNQVQNSQGVAAASTTANFNVSVAAFTTPTASISAPNITTAGGQGEVITVTYSSSDSNIAASSVSTGDITVTGPAGTLTVLSAVAGPTAPTLSATYIVAAPAGGWTFTDDGTYTVTVNPNQVRDQALQYVATTSSTFSVSVAAPDTTPPTATLTSAPTITATTSSPEAITFTYQDNVAINTATIQTSNLIITGPTGTPVSVASVQIQGSGATVVATYNINPPGGSWKYANNGPYSIVLRGGSVTDTSGNGVPIVTGRFIANVPQPDMIPPVAAFTAVPSITSTSTSPEKITINYTDNVAVATSTIGTGNLTVTGPNGAVAVTGVSVTGSGASVIAVYSIAAPSGGWAFANDGTYTVTVKSPSVTDTSGNPAVSVSDTFLVNVPAPTPTSDDFNGGTGLNTTFVAEAITALSNGDLVVAGQQGSSAASNSQAVLEELNSDGSVNTSFGKNGLVTDSASLNDAFYAVAAQGSDIISGGTENGLFMLARYNSNGQLDTSFGSGGRATVSFGSPGDTIHSFAFTSSGDIVAVGSAGNNFAFAEFDANGHPVSSFGSNGLIQFNSATAGNDADILGKVAVNSSGQIIAAGADGGSVAVVELNSNGTASSGFGNGGLVVLSSGAGALAATTGQSTPDFTVGLALESDGTILVANHTSTGHFGMDHLLANGSVDTAFGGAGTAIADFGNVDDADAVLIEPTGQIIVIGNTTPGSGGPGQAAVAAFNSSGSLISTFGNNGLITLSNITPDGSGLHAFGFVTTNGQILMGASGGATASVNSATIHRLIVPGASTDIAETALGTFGQTGKKNVKLVHTLADGTTVTFTLKGGTATAFLVGNDVRLAIAASGGALTITAKGGVGRIDLADVTVTGSLKNVTAKTADLSGTLWTSGTLGTVNIGNVTGTIASTGSISSITAASLTDAFVLAGANLGADGEIGGNDDSYAAGNINTLKVTGAITGATIAAGIAPTNGDFATPSAINGSAIKTITAKSADATTRFIAASIKTAKLPKPVKIATDSRFVIA